MAGRNGVRVYCFLLAVFAMAASQSQDYDILVEGNGVSIVTGNATDVFVDVLCRLREGTSSWQWHVFPVFTPSIPFPLNPAETSYDENTGLLRVYASFIEEHGSDGQLQLQCLERIGSAHVSAVITLVLADSLFFTQTLPSTISPQQNLTALCLQSLPTLPQLTVSTQSVDVAGGTSYMFCEVDSARGSFRSRSVAVESADDSQAFVFIIQPTNLTAQPTRGMARAAFSCAVSPGNAVQSITWYFDPADPGSGQEGMPIEPLSLDPSNPDVTVETEAGTSILVLDGVGLEQEGGYHCEVTLEGGAGVMVSDTGSLTYNRASSGDRIILPPPPSLSYSEGDTVVIPCVGTTGPGFQGPAASGGVTSSFGLTFSSVQRENDGMITCQVGSDEAEVDLSIEAPPQFETPFPPEVIGTTSQSSTIRLSCEVSSNPTSTISFLKDGQPIAPGNDFFVFPSSTSCSLCVRRELLIQNSPARGQEGVYQCVAQVVGDGSTTIVSSTYVNIQFLDTPTITTSIPGNTITLLQPNTPSEVLLNCTAEAHPIPSLTWTRDGGPVSGQQGITGFRETAFSVLTVPVEGLEGRVEFRCRAEGAGLTEEVTEVIIARSEVTNTEQPQSPMPLLIGETATLSCAASSIPIPGITWFRTQNGQIPIADNGGDVIIQSVMQDDTTVRSTLQLLLNDEMDFSGYFCRGNNGFLSRDSNTVQIEQAFAPIITLPPQDIIAVRGEQVTFICRSRGNPLPALTWSLDTGSISNMQTGENEVESRLSLTALVNGTTVTCTAANRVDTVTSDDATLTIADIPTSPTVTIANTTARTVTVEWTSSFSALPITQYSITIQRRDSPSDNRTTIVGPAVNRAEFTGLRPFSVFSVVVVAESRAGRNSGSTIVTTLADAPDAPPTNIVAEAQNVDSIKLTWDPPPADQRNGLIISYLVQYQSQLQPADQGTERVDTGDTITIEITISGLRTNTTYNIILAAMTVVGLGPFSGGVIQQTYPQPPTFSTVPPSTAGSATQTVIPVTLPLPETDISEFSHFWVIAIRLSDSSQSFLTSNPSQTFPNNDTFVRYSANIEPNTPYVVSEMSASSYQTLASDGVFFLGDENRTRGENNFPELYRNGPLVAGERYTVFVWAFPHSIPSQSASEDDPVAKRQAISPRQYTVFSSSEFLPATSTQPVSSPVDDGLNGGEVVGVVIAVLLLLALFSMVVVMAMLLARMWFRKVKDLGPPPTRQGSKRFQEDRSVVTIVSNPRTDSELQDLNPDDVRLPTPVEEFAEHVRKMHANTDHLFSEEYQIITIKSPGLPHIQGSLTNNVMKNRYANINCFDDTRVRLTFLPGVEGSDYVNANYIDGYQQKQAYIATQGPLPNTVHDFWRMVWEEDSCCVIMLTNLVEKSRVKCHQYWPETGSLGLGDITVTVIDMQELAYYTIRTFRVSRGNDRREVKQFHYTGWPDFGVPDHPHPIIAFIRRINNFKRTTSGPDIIHCSAGVGRSGTLICIQAMMEMMEEEGTVDIFNTILAMRRQRNYMVQTERQYIFIHDAVLELIRIGNTEVSIQSLRKTFKHLQEQNPHSETSGMEEEYLKLCEMPPVDNSLFSNATSSANTVKNRHPNILPLDSYRVRLLMVPGVTGSDYINASYVDGYQRRHQYILTQGPMKNTVDEFWRMIWEHRVSAIMMLCQVEERGKEMCVRYWPTDKLKQHGDLFIELVQENDYPNYTCREFSLTNTKINESRLVKHYHYTDWTEESCPVNSSAIIDLIGVLQKTQHQNGGGPIVLHDSTPIGRAGTFCVLSSVLEQLKVEGVVDLFFFIHALRQQQPGLICTFEQYKFCYKSILEFLDSFDHYSNFD